MNKELIANIQVLRAHRMGYPPHINWGSKSSKMNCCLIWTIFQGKGQLQIAKKSFTLAVGDCFFLPPNESFVLINNRQDPLMILCLHFDFRDERNRPVYLPAQELPCLYRRLPNGFFFSLLVERVVEAGIDHPDCPRAENDLAKAVLYEICRIDEKRERLLQAPWVEEICTTIRNHPERLYQVADLAKEQGYTSDYFSRIFKKYTGQTPSDYIIQTKIERAKDLLLESTLSVRQISDLLGYCDVFYFSKQFKQKVGMPPLKYRRQ